MSLSYEPWLQQYAQAFPHSLPKFIIRVPGRVNLIGEHTDYNGLPVMPMAISREVKVVLAPRPDAVVELYNVQERFGRREFAIENSIPAYETGDWGNYAKAGVQGMIDLAIEMGQPLSALHGFSALIDSDLPMAAGLSSSSAIVVAAALAFLAVNDIAIERTDLADRLAAAERYVGTMGGGMDQAVILLAQAGSALKIDFFPVRTQPVSLPGDYSVVICNSMVVAPKTAAARLIYNRRPIECRLAAAILAQHLSDTTGNSGNTSLTHTPAMVQRVSELLPYFTPQQLLAAARSVFGEGSWSKKQAADAVGMSVDDLDASFFRMRDGQILPEFPDGLPLLDRMTHVLSEGQRVVHAAQALQVGDAPAFGALMNASHASCRDRYGISCPELEQLVAVAKGAGAIGARLTGAGFGGCTVNLVPNDLVDAFRAAVIAHYYEDYLKTQHPDQYTGAAANDFDNAIIVSVPCQGAEILPA